MVTSSGNYKLVKIKRRADWKFDDAHTHMWRTKVTEVFYSYSYLTAVFRLGSNLYISTSNDSPLHNTYMYIICLLGDRVETS